MLPIRHTGLGQTADKQGDIFRQPDCTDPRVAITKITGQGLISIAILVAVLWACVIGERVIAGRANDGAAQALRAMRTLQMKNRREPAASPARPLHRRLHADVG